MGSIDFLTLPLVLVIHSLKLSYLYLISHRLSCGRGAEFIYNLYNAVATDHGPITRNHEQHMVSR